MELFLETNDRDEIDHVKNQLESNGIPVFVGNENTSRIYQYIGPDAKLSLWILIKEQYEDAVLLLQNSEHEVKNPIDVNKFYLDLENNKTSLNYKIFKHIILIIVLSIIAVFILYFLQS